MVTVGSSLESLLPNPSPEIPRCGGSLLRLSFPGQRRDNPGRGLKSSLVTAASSREPLAWLALTCRGLALARLTSRSRRRPLCSCPRSRPRLRDPTALSRRLHLNAASCQAARDALRLRRPMTSRRPRRRRRSRRSGRASLFLVTWALVGEWPLHGLEARAGSESRRPLLRDLWDTLRGPKHGPRRVPLKSSLTFTAEGGTCRSERVSRVGGGAHFIT